MDLNDVLGHHPGRPNTQDFWRLSEISLELTASMREAADDPIKQLTLFQERVESIGDFESIAHHATQVAMSIHNVKTGPDLLMLRLDPRRSIAYIQTIQAFLDGFITGATFEKRGGHRDD